MKTGFNIQRSEGKQAGRGQGIVVGLIFAIIGVAVVAFSINSMISYNVKNKSFVPATAEVVDHEIDSDGLRAIIVEYEVDGQTYTKTSNTYSNIPDSIGTAVEIKYDPNNPADSIWTNDGANILVLLGGVLFTVAGVTVVVSRVKAKKGTKNTKGEQTVIQPIGSAVGGDLAANVDSVPQQPAQTVAQQPAAAGVGGPIVGQPAQGVVQPESSVAAAQGVAQPQPVASQPVPPAVVATQPDGQNGAEKTSGGV